MDRTYGVDIVVEFNPFEHPLDKKEYYQGKAYCSDIFKTLVRKNERIDIEEKRSYTFSPIDPGQTEVDFEFFSTSKDDTNFITDPEVVSENVVINLASPDTRKGTDRVLRLDVMFGGTELKVKVTDVESGKRWHGIY